MNLILKLTLFPFHLPPQTKSLEQARGIIKVSSHSCLIRCTINIFVVNLQDIMEVPWLVLLSFCIKNSADFHLLHVD